MLMDAGKVKNTPRVADAVDPAARSLFRHDWSGVAYWEDWALCRTTGRSRLLGRGEEAYQRVFRQAVGEVLRRVGWIPFCPSWEKGIANSCW